MCFYFQRGICWIEGVHNQRFYYLFNRSDVIFFFQTPLGLIFKNENVNEEMLSILKDFHSYLPQTEDHDIDGQLFSGDQLTVERAVNVIASVANGHTPEDRLDGINLQIGDWHAAVKLLCVSIEVNNHGP